MSSRLEVNHPAETAPKPPGSPLGRSRRLRGSVLVSVILAVVVIIVLVLATIPLVQVVRPGVAWFGVRVASCPSGCVSLGHSSEFCPPVSYNSVTGNVTLSFTWVTESGHSIQKFWMYVNEYPLNSYGSFVYTATNISAGNFSYESPTLAVSLCRDSVDFGATSATPDTVAVTMVTTYTYTTTVPIL